MKSVITNLQKLTRQSTDMEWGKTDREFCSKYAISTPNGRKAYTELTDEDLLGVLRDRAAELGHSPSQKEVFWVWREYIKMRFKKWPYALILAGLPKGAGSGGLTLERVQQNEAKKEEIIQKLQSYAKELGRLPHPNDLPNIMEDLHTIKCGWNEVILAAGLDQEFFKKYTLCILDDLEPEYRVMLEKISELAHELGRAPRRHEVDQEDKQRLVDRCGTWRNALHQIGLEPIRSIHPFASTHARGSHVGKKIQHKKSLHDCYYRVLNLDEENLRDLGIIMGMKARHGRIPERHEVPKDIRKRLQEKCGSWSNVIFQLQYIKEEQNEKLVKKR